MFYGNSYNKGLLAEDFAIQILKKKNYTIIGKRVRTKYGEIDILAQKDDFIIAVEVKFRNSFSIAHECISEKQKRRIFKSLLVVMSERNNSFENYRIDVIFIIPNGQYQHIENAFIVQDNIY